LMCEERNCKQGKIEDLEKELGRKNMSLSILENELLLLKKGQGTF
jgi:predicted RNase H-like nuclease (RuvC/YqgF family)